MIFLEAIRYSDKKLRITKKYLKNIPEHEFDFPCTVNAEWELALQVPLAELIAIEQGILVFYQYLQEVQAHLYYFYKRDL